MRELGELHCDPQVIIKHTFVEWENPICGRLREPLPPVRSGAGPLEPAGPGLGEHSDEILREIGAGGRIAELRAQGTVARVAAPRTLGRV